MRKSSWLLKMINFWPPFMGARVRVKKIAPDFTSIDVEMRLRFWNKNYFGVHFGGSLYAMTDPFFVLMLVEHLGKNYMVWDKSASIHFKKPGKGCVRAHFQIPKEQINFIRIQADQGMKVEPEFQVLILDESNSVIAEVQKKLYVRKKEKTFIASRVQ